MNNLRWTRKFDPMRSTARRKRGYLADKPVNSLRQSRVEPSHLPDRQNRRGARRQPGHGTRGSSSSGNSANAAVSGNEWFTAAETADLLLLDTTRRAVLYHDASAHFITTKSKSHRAPQSPTPASCTCSRPHQYNSGSTPCSTPHRKCCPTSLAPTPQRASR